MVNSSPFQGEDYGFDPRPGYQMKRHKMDIWQSDSEYLRSKMDADITKRSIRRIAFNHDGKLLVAEVGKPSPYNGGMVRAIYEDGKRGCYLICAGVIEIAPKDSLVEEAA